MAEVMRSLHNSQAEIVIISDANDFGITKILARFLGEDAARAVPLLTNKTYLTKTGCLQINPFTTQWDCDFCPQNLCKGSALEAYIAQTGPFERVVYVGDGKNDICPVLRLVYCLFGEFS